MTAGLRVTSKSTTTRWALRLSGAVLVERVPASPGVCCRRLGRIILGVMVGPGRRIRDAVCWTVGLLLLAACGAGGDQPASQAPTNPTDSHAPRHTGADARAGDPSAEVGTSTAGTGRYASPNPGSVNAYWVTGPGGLIVVDTGRNRAGGRAIAGRLRATGQPVAAFVITHPHPDHVGGLEVLHAEFPDAPVYASPATATTMREDPLGFYPLARQADPDFPDTVPVPDHLVGDGQTLSVAGLRLLVTTSWSPGESATATTYQDVDQHRLFVGDLVDNAMTPALLEGHSCGWLRNLTRLEDHYPAALEAFPGHGRPAPLEELVTAQRTYLRTFRRLVRRTIENGSPGGPRVTKAETAHVTDRMRQLFPGHPNVASLPTLKQVNVSSVAKELQESPRCIE